MSLFIQATDTLTIIGFDASLIEASSARYRKRLRPGVDGYGGGIGLADGHKASRYRRWLGVDRRW
jgi:hypothetical protein